MMNISQKEDPEVIKNAIRLLIRLSGPSGISPEHIRDHFKNQGINIGLVNQLLSEIMSESQITTRGSNS